MLVIRFNHTSRVAVVTPTERPKSVRNRCVIEVFSSVFCVVTLLFRFFWGVGAFVIGLSQISSFFSSIGVITQVVEDSSEDDDDDDDDDDEDDELATDEEWLLLFAVWAAAIQIVGWKVLY